MTAGSEFGCFHLVSKPDQDAKTVLDVCVRYSTPDVPISAVADLVVKLAGSGRTP